jgi:hypothetical protein
VGGLNKAIMADIVNLHNYIMNSKHKRSFTPWQKRFGEELDFFSGLPDLPDKLLFLLADPDLESLEALRELVMAVLGKGAVTKYLFLTDQEQSTINNIAFFLQEQINFEIMGRLGWIADYACRRYSLVALVENYNNQNEACGRAVPMLFQTDPEFSEFIKFSPELQKKYLKSRFPKAYESFKEKLKQTGLIK